MFVHQRPLGCASAVGLVLAAAGSLETYGLGSRAAASAVLLQAAAWAFAAAVCCALGLYRQHPVMQPASIPLQAHMPSALCLQWQEHYRI
jgi:hypothetical protein